MEDKARLIEVAFPLKQASIDSVHEKNVRHGHISTLHIWPARRPLAASRAALIATLLPDPGNPEERRRLVERIGGRVVRKEAKKNGKVVVVEETEGGILHWGRESSPDLAWFREEIRKAYGGRAPRVLDPFAGGGAIPLEAMRLGCDVTAIDINPVAWFLLKCTLDYPQRLAGQKRPLPAFALKSPDFITKFLEGAAKGTKTSGRKAAAAQTAMFDAPDADLAWHVRAWGMWVLEEARSDLERFYPIVDGKPTVSYLWARTVTCKSCRSNIPLLKTRWLCKKDEKRVLFTMKARRDKSGLDFGIAYPSAVEAKDKNVAAGTMSRSGAQCPFCPAIMTMEDIRYEGKEHRLGAMLTAVVVDGTKGKEYRLPTKQERAVVAAAERDLPAALRELPRGPLDELINTGSIKKGGVSITRWGISRWGEVFTKRQLLSLAVVNRHTKAAADAMARAGYPAEWQEALSFYLASMLDRLANQSSSVARWNNRGEKVEGTFARFALSLLWDFAELNPVGKTTGGYLSAVEWVSLVVAHLCGAALGMPAPTVRCQSVIASSQSKVDLIVTDPPYYDAIPYADVMDFFYVWLRRTVPDTEESSVLFAPPQAPKWDSEKADGELIEDESRFGGDSALAKAAYEDGMARAFLVCHEALQPDGRLVVVFANKQPDAWETLVSAIIRAGFVVDGSWPIQTEMGTRTRALVSAALSASVWLVCKKRPETARPGWDNRVLDEMRENIYKRLRDFWDAGIRGPDFVWAATGPAMEAYSKHPVVKKANEPGQLMAVGEFLRHVRRIVVDFVVGRVLTHDGGGEAVAGLDDVTTYYLLHRHDFGMGDAPAGACILYAVSCGVSDRDLTDQWDLLARTGGKAPEAGIEEREDGDEGEEAESTESTEGSGSKVRLKAWEQRRRKGMGFDAEGRQAPLIDQVHRLLHLWRAGDVAKVDDYLDARALRKNQLFHKVLQALIELAPEGSEERALMESVSNHVSPRSQPAEKRQRTLPIGTEA